MSDFEERKKEVERLKSIFEEKVNLGDLVGASMTLAQLQAVVFATEPVDDGKTFTIEWEETNTQHSQKT